MHSMIELVQKCFLRLPAVWNNGIKIFSDGNTHCASKIFGDTDVDCMSDSGCSSIGNAIALAYITTITAAVTDDKKLVC